MMWIIGVIVLVYIAAVDGYSSRALKFHQGNKILQPSCRIRPTSVLQQSTTAAASFGDSELPNDFIDSVDRAVESTVRCMSTGVRRCRVDFDTTVGDMTYTSLKNSLPFTEEFVKRLAYRLGYAVPEVIKEEGDEEASKATEGEASEASPSLPVEPPQAIVPTEIIKIFFPDMGAAALARKDWKLNEDEPKLPNCVVTANIKNDPIQSKDKLVIMLCPQYSEADSVKRVIQLCDDEGTPCILVNPNIINMDQGFGVRKSYSIFFIHNISKRLSL